MFATVGPFSHDDYQYPILSNHPAGCFFYHPHRHGSVAFQVRLSIWCIEVLLCFHLLLRYVLSWAVAFSEGLHVVQRCEKWGLTLWICILWAGLLFQSIRAMKAFWSFVYDCIFVIIIMIVTEQPFGCKYYSTSSLGFNKLNIRRSIKQTESTIHNHDSNNLNNGHRPNPQCLVRAWNQQLDWRANSLWHNVKGEHETTQVISKFPQSPPAQFLQGSGALAVAARVT